MMDELDEAEESTTDSEAEESTTDSDAEQIDNSGTDADEPDGGYLTGHGLRRGIEFLGRHPFATGVFALMGLFGLGLSVVGYLIDRMEAQDATEQLGAVEEIVEGIRVESASYKVPQIIGLSYDVARELILREGWAPDMNHWTHGTTVDVQSGNGPIFWGRGYWEVDACAGTGLGQCKFEFFDPEVRVLVVTTAGEEASDGSYHAKVSRVFLADGPDDPGR